MALVAGFDSSTQTCKALVVDAETGRVVRSGSCPHPPGTEVRPERWYEALRIAAERAGGIDDVSAWAIAGQQHGMVALDRDGEVLRPALLWNDTRSAPGAAALIEEFGAEQLARRTGTVPVASITSTKLRWFRDHEPELARRTAAVALPHDWLTWRLRGFGPGRPELAELVTDRSEASGTGYWNPTTGRYDEELFVAALGTDALRPRVLPHDGSVLDAAGRVVGPGAGDNAAAALGLGLRAGDAAVSIGTSGTVFAVSDDPIRDASGAIAGFADATGRYLPIVVTLNAARVLEAAARLLGVDLEELGRLAQSADDGADGLVLTPYYEGERTPDLPDATASLTGMTLANTTRENFARASVEGMLSGLRAGLDLMRGQGIPLRRALLIGGGSRSEAVQRIAGARFGLPVEVPAPAEYAALGAARQAATILGAPAWGRPGSG